MVCVHGQLIPWQRCHGQWSKAVQLTAVAGMQSRRWNQGGTGEGSPTELKATPPHPPRLTRSMSCQCTRRFLIRCHIRVNNQNAILLTLCVFYQIAPVEYFMISLNCRTILGGIDGIILILQMKKPRLQGDKRLGQAQSSEKWEQNYVFHSQSSVCQFLQPVLVKASWQWLWREMTSSLGKKFCVFTSL